MKCIAIDDEPLAINVIKDYCSKVGFLELTHTFNSAIEASKIIYAGIVDIVFLDIQMPHLTGLEFVKTLPNSPFIIFTTAYHEHALQGFELSAIDYLVKPIPFERFLKAINKAHKLYMLKNQPPSTPNENANGNNLTKYILAKVGYSDVRINIDEIFYIEGVKDYAKVVTKNKSFLIKSTLINLEEKLPKELFLRVHKSYIVSLANIEKIENNCIVFSEKRFPIGDNYKAAFFKIIEKHII